MSVTPDPGHLLPACGCAPSGHSIPPPLPTKCGLWGPASLAPPRPGSSAWWPLSALRSFLRPRSAPWCGRPVAVHSLPASPRERVPSFRRQPLGRAGRAPEGRAPRSSPRRVGNASAPLAPVQSSAPGRRATGTGTRKWGSDFEPQWGGGRRSVADQDRNILDDLGQQCRCAGPAGERSAGEGSGPHHRRGGGMRLGRLQGGGQTAGAGRVAGPRRTGPSWNR